jgi:hypothetical protein
VRDLVQDQKSLVERASSVFVHDQAMRRDEGRPASVEDGRAPRRRFDVEASPLGLRYCEVVWAPGIVSEFYPLPVEIGRPLSSEFDRIHLQSSSETRSEMTSSGTLAWRKTCSRLTFSPIEGRVFVL